MASAPVASDRIIKEDGMNTRKWMGFKIVCIITSLLLGQRLTEGQEVSGIGLAQEIDGATAEYWSFIPVVMRNLGYHESPLDPSFDEDGIVVVDLTEKNEHGRAVALQPDGKLVVAGYTTYAYDSQFLLARFNSDGSLDTTFGSGSGWITTSLSSGSNFINDIVLQDDGKILAAGNSGDYSASDFALARYNPDGSLDTTFDGDGFVITDFAGGTDTANGVALAADGKIVVAGTAFTAPPWSSYDIALARYNPDGSLDTSFDGDGKVLTGNGYYIDDGGHAITLQEDGKILVAGMTIIKIDYSSYRKFIVARYNLDGSLDTTFDGDGMVIPDFNGYSEFANDILVQPDGKIVVVGRTDSAGTIDFALARYNPDGSLDTSFDEDGKVITNLLAINTGNAVALQPDGKILMAGFADTYYDPYSDAESVFALARYNPDGSLDTSFDEDGWLTTELGDTGFYPNHECYDIVLQPDGKIVLAGESGASFALVRYK
jgi:uncharacterized delta-60 repeat protein